MRTTPIATSQEIIQNLNQDTANIGTVSEQLSTGYTVNQPSDNPSQIGNILYQNALISRTQQYVSNAQGGVNVLGQADSAINQATSLLDQAEQIVVDAVGPSNQGAGTPSSQALAGELNAVTQSLYQVANQQYLGIPIFGGTTGQAAAFDTATGDYIGSANATQTTVAPGVSLPTSVIGSQIFGDAAVNPNTSVFAVLQDCINDITAGNINNLINVDEPNLQTVIGQVQSGGATVGSLYQSMQQALSTAQATQTTLQNQVNEIDDTNVAQATTTMQEDQNTYQAALYAASEVNKYSLIQFVS